MISVYSPKAKTRKHIMLLSRLRPDTLEDFAVAGIQTLDQIVQMHPDELRHFRGIKTTAHAVHASARAWVEECAVWYGQLHSLCRTSAFYFDIETLKNERGDDEIWSIGWCREDANIQIIIVAPDAKLTSLTLADRHAVTLVPDAESAWHVFADAVAGSEQPVFHWSPFDASVMRRSAPEDVKFQLARRLHDLCKSFDNAVKLPIKGVSLKTVARHIGFDWHGYDHWFAAFLDYREWQRTGDVNALASACTYQSDDVEAMVMVQRWLVENAPNE